MHVKLRVLVQLCLVVPSVAWHGFLCFKDPHGTLGPSVFVFFLGILPYLALAAMLGLVRTWQIVIVASLVQILADCSASLTAMHSKSSTAGVALVVQPLFSLFLLVPVVAGIALLVDHWRERKRVERSKSLINRG
jgi:hypothetical protein